jgi:hypothetical protein
LLPLETFELSPLAFKLILLLFNLSLLFGLDIFLPLQLVASQPTTNGTQRTTNCGTFSAPDKCTDASTSPASDERSFFTLCQRLGASHYRQQQGHYANSTPEMIKTTAGRHLLRLQQGFLFNLTGERPAAQPQRGVHL